MLKSLFAAATVTVLAGCASSIIQGYVGKPISEIIEDYGFPSGAYDTAPGRRTFIWVRKRADTFGGSSTTNASIVGNQLFATTITSPPTTMISSCNYVGYATRTRTDINGPAAWTLVGFKKPKLLCE